MQITVNTTVFKSKLRKYAVASKQTIQESLKEEARLIAQKLASITPPKTKAQGKRRVTGDIDRVYLSPKWFKEVFVFRHQNFGDRVKENIENLEIDKLRRMFYPSPRLSKIHIEPFDTGIIKRFRHNGRVGRGVAPYSFPLLDEGEKKSYIDRKNKMVGYAKSGWGYCVNALGGSVADWMNKGANGKVMIMPDMVVIINQTKTIYELDAKGRFSQYVIRGRDKDLAKKISKTLEGVGWN